MERRAESQPWHASACHHRLLTDLVKLDYTSRLFGTLRRCDRPFVLSVVHMFKIRVLALLFAISLSPQAVLADEIDLGGWKTHAAMAERVPSAAPLPISWPCRHWLMRRLDGCGPSGGPIRGRSSGARPNLKAGPMLTMTPSTIF